MASFYYLYSLWRFRKSAIIILTPILLLPLLLIDNSKVSSCGYVICIMSVYWTTEACPLAVTSLIPVVLFPLFGIQSADEISMSYMKHTCFLFIGTFVLCIAIEEWNLHRRFALRLLLLFGSKPCWIMLGMMLITAFLSMWLSNTSTCALMHPITVAICREISNTETKKRRRAENNVKQLSKEVYEISDDIENLQDNHEVTQLVKEKDVEENMVEKNDEEAPESTKSATGVTNTLEKSMLLAVTYASTLGGICTTVGTPTNLVAIGIFVATFGEDSAQDINFVSWFIFCLPMSVILIFITWFWVLCRFKNLGQLNPRNTDKKSAKRIKGLIQANYDELPPMSFGEICVMIHFLILILLWFLRDPKIFTGWKSIFPNGYAKDSTTAVLVGISVFLFPSTSSSFSWIWKKRKTEEKEEESLPSPSQALLSWDTFQQKFPWGVMLLLGGGFSLAGACVESGLSEWFGRNLTSVLEGTPIWTVLLVVSVAVSLLTEFTSNVATTSIFLPIMIGLSGDLGINPVFILLTATLSSSFAFSLPIATPPNALAFTFGSLRIVDMVSTGMPLNFICVGVLNVFIHLTGVPIFHLDVIPEWAAKSNATIYTATLMHNSTISPS